MKKLLRLTAVFAAIALLSSAPGLMAAEAKGSIRPQGEDKSADLPALAKITFQKALDVALAKVPGQVIKAELEVEDGCLMYSFEIVGPDKKITEVEIDAGNGKVLDTEDESSEANGASAGESGKKD
jgi:uncharacterized membrane protein YkoI